MSYHKPVMLNECINALSIKESGKYCDVTFGGGGHAKEILTRLGEKGQLLAFDQDEEALENTFDDSRFTLVNSNFKYLRKFIRLYDMLPLDGILADLGVSSHQIDSKERGFSIRYDSELDLRMDKRMDFTAADLVNTYEHEELANVLYNYGDIKKSRAIATVIIKSRDVEAIKTTAQLMEVTKSFAPPYQQNKFYARLFQALRIEVNDELGTLKDLLSQSLEVLAPGGVIVVMSYHSLEDKLVKSFLKTGNFKGEVVKDFYGNVNTPFNLVNRKVIIPSEQEIVLNPRARSAKLRVAVKK